MIQSNIIQLTKRVSTILALLVILQISTWAKDHNHVLLINSYNYSFPTTKDYLKGLHSVFDTLDLELDIEFMDWKNLPTEQNKTNFYNYIKFKLNASAPFDAIIVSDDMALQFITEYQNELCKNTPIVFSGVNNTSHALAQNKNKNITGITESVSIKENIDLIQNIYPESLSLYYIVDNTLTGLHDLKKFNSITNQYPKTSFKQIHLKNLSFAELKDQLKSISQTEPVILLSAYKDKNGNTKDFYESLRLINANLKSPLFHIYKHGLGKGILGGKMVSHFVQGQQAGLIVNRILKGESISNIPVVTNSSNQYLFDYNELKKHNIDTSILPIESTIINKPETFYQINKEAIFFIIIFLLIQSLLIIYLYKINSKRKLAQKKLQTKVMEHYRLGQRFKMLNDQLHQKNNDLLTTEEELRANNEELYEKNERIAESEERYRLLFNNLNEAYALHKVVFDENDEPVDYIFIDANPKFLSAVKYSYNELINKSTKQLFPQTEETWIKRFGEVAKTGVPMKFREYSAEIGKYFETTVFSPKQNYFAAVFMDVTKETESSLKIKEAYDKIRVKESISKKMFNSAPVVMIILNKNSEIIDINKTGLELMKKDISKALGLRGGDFLSCIHASLNKKGCGNSAQCNSCILNKTVSKTITSKVNANKTDFDIHVQDENNNVKTLNFHVSTAILTDQEDDKILVCMENVTSLKEQKSQLKKRNNEINKLLTGAKQILSVNDFNKTIDNIFKYCQSLTGATSGFVGIRENDVTQILFKSINGKDEYLTEPISKTKNELLNNIYKKKEIYINNHYNNNTLPSNHIFVKNILIAPIIIKNKAVGVLALSNKPTDFNIDDVNILSAFSELAALSLNNTRSNQLIEESEQKFKQTYFTSPDAISIISADGRFININNYFTEMLGYTESDVIGKKSSDLGIWHNPEKRKYLYNILNAEGKIKNFESQFKTKDNTIITALISASIIKLNNTNHILAISKDISELKQQTYYLDKAQEIGNIGSWSYDLRKEIFTWSDQCYQIFGIKNKEFITLNHILEVIHPEDQKIFLEKWQNCLKGEIYTLDFRIIVDGNIKWIYQKVDIEFNSNNEVSKIYGLKMDITQRKNYEWQITQINKRFKGLEEIVTYKANSIPDLLDHTLEKVISYTNSTYGAIYHYDDKKNIFFLNNWTKDYELTTDLSNINCLNQAVTSKKAVIINDSTSKYDFLKKKIKNQDQLKSLTIPIMANGNVVAVLWVANTIHDYHDFHAKQVMLLLETTWIIVEKQRLQERL